MPLSGTLTLDFTISGENPSFGSLTTATNNCSTPPSVSLLLEQTRLSVRGPRSPGLPERWVTLAHASFSKKNSTLKIETEPSRSG
jgi:hypothetical protein